MLTRYDWAANDVLYNNFLFIHDDDINSVGFHNLISVMNVILLFPFAMEILTDHKKLMKFILFQECQTQFAFIL